jgi:hypothetical protein
MSFPEPTRVGSYGTIFYGQGKGKTGRDGLSNNNNKLQQELHHKSVADAIQPKRPDGFNKYARQVGLLYGIGTDSPVVAHALINEDIANNNQKFEGHIGVSRSALEMVLEGINTQSEAGTNEGSGKKKPGAISREFPTDDDKSMSSFDRFGDVSPVHRRAPVDKRKDAQGKWNKKGAQPLTITESIYKSERMDGGKWHIDNDKKKDDYTAPMVAASAGPIGNSITTTPKSWPDQVGYTKSVSRPHPEVDTRFQQGLVDKACTKSRLGSMRSFNRANSSSIYDSSSGFIHTNNKKKTATKRKQHQPPKTQGPVDDASVLSFEYGGAPSIADDGTYATWNDDDDHMTLDGSVASPSGGGGNGGSGKYQVSFDAHMYESADRRDEGVLVETQHQQQFLQTSQAQSSSSPGGKAGVLPDPIKRKDVVLVTDEDADYVSYVGMDVDSVLGDIGVDEIYSKRDSMAIAATGVGRSNTAGENPPQAPSRLQQIHQQQQQPVYGVRGQGGGIGKQPQQQPHHSQMHYTDFDERSVLTDSETIHFTGGKFDDATVSVGGDGAGDAKARVYAVDYGDVSGGLVIKQDDKKRRGGISVGGGSSVAASEGASWVNAVGADGGVEGGRVIGFEYRREKYDAKGRPVDAPYHHNDDKDTDEHSVGSYKSFGSLGSNSHSYGQQQGRHMDYADPRYYASQFNGEMGSEALSKFDSRDLVCGKLKTVELNSATRVEMEKSVKRGMNAATKQVVRHAKLLLGGPGGSKNMGVVDPNARNPNDGYHDDGTIASDGLQLSMHDHVLMNVPGNIDTGASIAGSDTISQVKHALGKRESPHNLERGGEHAQHHLIPSQHGGEDYHDKHHREVSGLGNTAAGRFKMNFGGSADSLGSPQQQVPGISAGNPENQGSHMKEKPTFNALQPEHMRWSKLAGQGMEGKFGQPDLETRRAKIIQLHEDRKEQRRREKQARKDERHAQASRRWHERLVAKKNARRAQGLDSDTEDEEWSDEELVVTSDEDEAELEQHQRDLDHQLYQAELSALPHDKRFDKQGNLIVTTKMTVSSLIGKGPATGEEGSPDARQRQKENIATRKKRGEATGGKPLPGSDVTFYNPENNRSYADHLNQHLDVPTEKISGNPFRPSQRAVARATAKSVTKIPVVSEVNPLEYRAEATHRKAGNFGVIIKAEKTTRGGVPTRNEIQEALSQAARKNLLAYDTRIVETGSLLKAVNHHGHSSPGIPAIVQLHKAFVEAAAMNPNPWLLKRDQVASVIREELPWLDGGSLRRLVSAYDPHGTGLIKYVKMSVSLVCASKPAMANLIVLLSRIEEERNEKKRLAEEEGKKWDIQQAAADSAKANAQRRYKRTSTETHSHVHDVGNEPFPSGKPRDDESVVSSASTYQGEYGSEKYLLQLLHGLYEDCEGTNTGRILKNNDRLLPPRTLAAAGCGMRLDDIVEVVSCCACNVEDELYMQRVMAPVVEEVYQVGRSKDIVLGDYDAEQKRIADEKHAEEVMIEREAAMRRLNEGKGGGDPHADDLSSNFTARSGFTPGPGAAPGTGGGVGGGGSVVTTRTQGSHLFHSGQKKSVAGSRYGDGYVPRWPQHSRSGSTSMVRDPGDRFSGTGMHSKSAKQVTKFMNQSRATDEQNALWMKGKEQESHARKRDGTAKSGAGPVRGGDSVAWDDESLAASSLASGGAYTAAVAGAGGGRKNRGLVRTGGGGRSTAGIGMSGSVTSSDSKYLADGRLTAAELIKHASIKSSVHLPRVEQQTFVSCMVDNPGAMETFVYQLDKWRKALAPYVKGGTISYEQSQLEELSYGSRLPTNRAAANPMYK